MRRTDTRASWGLAASVVLVLGATLWPAPSQGPIVGTIPWTCLLCGERGLADFILNVGLFAPLGLALNAAGAGFPASLALSAALTAAVEGLQAAVIPGRDPALGDLVANSLGGGLGWHLGALMALLASPKPRVARMALWTASALPVAVSAASAWLLQPALPGGQWYGQWPPAMEDRANPVNRWFSGEVLGAWMGADTLPRWELAESEGPRRRLLAEGPSLSALIASGTPEDRGRIVSVADSRGRHLVLAQDGRQLTFSVRLRADALRLSRPRFGLEDALPAHAGDTLLVSGQLSRGQVTLVAEPREGNGRRGRVTASPADTPALLIPYTITGGPVTQALRTLWAFAAFTPLVLVLAASGRLYAAFVLLIGGIAWAAVPGLLGVPVAGWSAWVGTTMTLAWPWALRRGEKGSARVG